MLFFTWWPVICNVACANLSCRKLVCLGKLGFCTDDTGHCRAETSPSFRGECDAVHGVGKIAVSTAFFPFSGVCIGLALYIYYAHQQLTDYEGWTNHLGLFFHPFSKKARHVRRLAGPTAGGPFSFFSPLTGVNCQYHQYYNYQRERYRSTCRQSSMTD